MTDNFKQHFNIIRFKGKRKKATIVVNGTEHTVHAKDRLFIAELGNHGYFMPTPDYGSHFIFEYPVNIKGTPSFLCTCGSHAVYVGSNVYQLDDSPKGVMMVCFAHANTGKHIDSLQEYME